MSVFSEIIGRDFCYISKIFYLQQLTSLETIMARMVICNILKKEAPGLDAPPYPGETGQRIFESISSEGWNQWLKRLTTIINENRLSTADPGSIEIIEKHMLGFLFGESDAGNLPPGFVPQGGKK